MRGHAAANQTPVIASNRIGTEQAEHRDLALTFYGSSFICDERGELIEQADRDSECILVHTFDLEKVRTQRKAWGSFP